MASKPRPWPNQALWARDAAAEQCQVAARILRPLQDHADMATAVRVNKALVALQTALRALEQVGAPTRPDSM